MMDKYRVHEVAKDMGVSNKDILALLAKYYPDEQRKHMTALSDAELNLVLDHYTQKHNLESLDSYFEAARKKQETAAPAPAEAPAAPAAKQPEQKIEIVVLPEDTPIEEEEVFEGKWRILRDGNTYVAELHNDADELLIKSQNYSELLDARGAIDTLKKHIKGNNFSVVVNRNGKFQFKLFSTANRLICNGEPYDTRNACLEKIEEVKKIAFTAEIVRG